MTLGTTEASTPTTRRALVVGVDVLSPTVVAADAATRQLVRDLTTAGIEVRTAATHLTQLGPRPHATVSVELPGLDPDHEWRALLAATEGAYAVWAPDREAGADSLSARAGALVHADRTGGRAVRFPGVEALVGSLTVAQVLAQSGIDRVVVMSLGDADPATTVRTRDHVRPVWRAGSLELMVEHAVDATLVPYEIPVPVSCCVDHG